MPAIDIDRDGAHEAARHELAKPIYPKASLSDRIDDWLREFLFRLIQKGSSIPGGWFTITLLAVIALIAGLVAVRIARRTMGSRREAQLFGPHALSAAEYRARAQEAAAQGDWSSAIRQRLRAVGRQLEEDGCSARFRAALQANWPVTPGRTYPIFMPNYTPQQMLSTM